MPTASSDLDQRAITMGSHLSRRSKLSTSISNHNYFLYLRIFNITELFLNFFVAGVLIILILTAIVLLSSSFLPNSFDMNR